MKELFELINELIDDEDILVISRQNFIAGTLLATIKDLTKDGKLTIKDIRAVIKLIRRLNDAEKDGQINWITTDQHITT